MTIRRLGGVLAAIAVAVTVPAAVAAPISTQVRVEGAAKTVLPETPITLSGKAGATSTVRDTLDTDRVTVPATSATAQLGRASSLFGVPLGFSVDPTFGSFVQRIGADTGTATAFWLFKVDHTAPPVGADAQTLVNGDSVLWYFTSNFNAGELDLTLDRSSVRRGGTFDATVTSFDGNGVATPAAGARITYAGQVRSTGTGGAATLNATRLGARLVGATRSGDVRSPKRAVCVYLDAPVPCSLIEVPSTTLRTKALSTFSGLAVGGTRVDIAIAKRTGATCRFLTRSGALAAARSCASPSFLRTGVSGGHWTYHAPRALAKGSYKVWTRALTPGGSRETLNVPGTNVNVFTVA